MRVRPATPDDADAIALVHVTTWKEAYRDTFGPALDQLTVAHAAERRRAWLEAPAPGTFTLVGELFGRVAGFANAGPGRDDPSAGELYAIYVLPQSWGTGLGPALMAAVLDGLREAGFDEAVLAVLAENPRARRFYEREGWTFVDERDGEHLGVAVREARYRRSLTD
jgi:ribosomal protein S18 acetylase RimI-like enzyme